MHGDNDFPPRVTGTQMMHGIGDFFERIGLFDERFDLSAFEPLIHQEEIFADKFCHEEHDLLAGAEGGSSKS